MAKPRTGSKAEIKAIVTGFMRRYRALSKEIRPMELTVKNGNPVRPVRLEFQANDLLADITYARENGHQLGFRHRFAVNRVFFSLAQTFVHMRLRKLLTDNEAVIAKL